MSCRAAATANATQSATSGGPPLTCSAAPVTSTATAGTFIGSALSESTSDVFGTGDVSGTYAPPAPANCNCACCTSPVPSQVLGTSFIAVGTSGGTPQAGVATPVSSQASGLADPTLPTKARIDATYARSLNDVDLDASIAEVKRTVDAEKQSSAFTDDIFDNLRILQNEKFGRANRTDPPQGQTAPAQDVADVEFNEEEFDVDSEDWVAPQPIPGIVRGNPARLRPTPSEDTTYQEVAMNTKLVVLQSQGSWSQVQLEDLRSGWITSRLLETKLPDPDARLHIVKSGETAQTIARHYYGAHSNKWGQDERFFVNVLYYTNLNFPAQAKDQGMTRPSGKEDEWEATVVKADQRIWIPGTDFALGLRGIVPSGSFTYEAWQTIKNFFIGGAGFIAGLLVGAVESIVDVFVGLWDLAKMAISIIKSIITGEIISDIKKLWDDLSNLTADDILNAGLAWFKEKWFAEGTWSKWYNRGWLIGYVIVEILLLIFTDGAVTLIKWAGKIGKFVKILEKFPTLAKMVKKAEQLSNSAVKAFQMGAKALSRAHQWAQRVLRIPLEIIKDTSEAAIERLKKLSTWAKDKLRHLNNTALKACLGCASPCKIIIEDVEKFLKELAAKGAKVGAKLGTDTEKILGSLPKNFNLKLIRKKLQSRPALKRLIDAAELTTEDMQKLAHFVPDGIVSEGESYRTFVRYLTAVVPAKTGGDINKFNKIIEQMMKVEGTVSEKVKTAIIRQGSALKGSMFEGFAKLHIPELGGKAFARVTFKKTGKLALEKVKRTADNFVKAADNVTGEIWEIKHTVGKVPADQVRDYQKILNQLTPDGVKVTGVNYLFPTKAAAELNANLKDVGFVVRYIAGNTAKVL